MEDFFKDIYFPEQKKKKPKKKSLPQIVKTIREHKVNSIDFSSQKNISYSQISMFNQCNKRWSLQYKEGIKIFSSTISTVFGTALHEVIQLYLTTMYDKSGAEADRLDLIGLFEDKLSNEYKEQYEKNNKKHFCHVNDLREHFDDGVEIINFFKKNKSKFFNKKGWYLVGCEIPLVLSPNPKLPNVVFGGFIDVVMYNENTESFLIIDIKTSTHSWGDKQKKDKNKQHQLILYKKFFSEQFNIALEKIDIEFFILKRKVITNPDFPTRRIQKFIPPHGKNSMNQATQSLNNFINKAFNNKGYSETTHPANPNKHNCKYCPFAFTQYCDKAVL